MSNDEWDWYWRRDGIDHRGNPCACGAKPDSAEWFLRTPTRGEGMKHSILFGFQPVPIETVPGLCPAVQ